MNARMGMGDTKRHRTVAGWSFDSQKVAAPSTLPRA